MGNIFLSVRKASELDTSVILFCILNIKYFNKQLSYIIHIFCYNCRWYPSQPGVETLMASIKSQFRDPWPTWKKVPEETRNQWWKEFQVYIMNAIICKGANKL